MILRLQKSWRIVVSGTIVASSFSSPSTAGRFFVPSVAAMASSSSSSAVVPPDPSSSSPSVRIAVAQLRSTEDKWRNLVHVARCAGWAKREGALLLCLPENLGFLGSSVRETMIHAEPPLPPVWRGEDQKEVEEAERDGNGTPRNDEPVSQALRDVVTQAAARGSGSCNDDEEGSRTRENPSPSHPIILLDGLRTIARQSGLWLTGTLHVAGAPPIITATTSTSPEDDTTTRPPQPRVYNTHVVLDDRGRLRAKYEKIHLFDVDIPGQVTLQESATTAPGHTVVACDSPVGRLGLTTCYDLRFPELYAELVRRGAQILLVPSAFTVPTGTAHWHTLLRARAIETQCYVVAAAQVGEHNAKRTSYGHSLAVDPWGTVLADAGGVDGSGSPAPPQPQRHRDPPSIVCCDVDLALVDSVRQRMPVQQHRQRAHFE